jgi:hypothetical protein
MHPNSVPATRKKIEPHRRGRINADPLKEVKNSWKFEFIEATGEGLKTDAKSGAGLRAALERLGVDGRLHDTVVRPSVADYPPVFELPEQPKPAITKGEAALALWMDMQQKKKEQRGFAAPCTVPQLHQWLERAPVGAWALYWEGYLAYDRGVEQRQPTTRSGEYPARAVGQALWQAHLRGRVELFQKRVGMGHYRYWARRVNDLPTRR